VKKQSLASAFLLLAASLLAPLAEASLTRSAAPRSEPPALALTLAAPEPSEFSLFDGTEIARALASRPALISISTDEEQTSPRTRFVSPSELSADELPNDAPELLPITSVREQRFNLQLPPNVFGLEPLRGPPGDEASYPKTRYRVFGLLGTPILGELRGVSLELHWGSGEFRAGLSSGTVGWLSQDPMEDKDSPNLYGFVKMRPHEFTDPMGLLGIEDVPGIVGDTLMGILDPRNAWTNAQRAAGGVVGAGKFVGKTAVGVGSLVVDAATMSVSDAAADRMVARGQGLASAISHPIDTVVNAHSDAFNTILSHEQKGEYFSSGAEAGELGVADAAAIYGGATAARSLLSAARTATARGVLQRVTTTTNARLAANPALAQEVLSDAEYAAGQASKRVAPMQYGNALERMVAERVQESRILGRLYEHVGGPSKPDFIGRGIFKGLNLDITTPGSVRAHLARPGYGAGLLISKYQRPAGFSLFPAAP
jgi:hypothetical protein